LYTEYSEEEVKDNFSKIILIFNLHNNVPLFKICTILYGNYRFNKKIDPVKGVVGVKNA
jgi:hypothetical protein